MVTANGSISLIAYSVRRTYAKNKVVIALIRNCPKAKSCPNVFGPSRPLFSPKALLRPLGPIGPFGPKGPQRPKADFWGLGGVASQKSFANVG